MNIDFDKVTVVILGDGGMFFFYSFPFFVKIFFFLIFHAFKNYLPYSIINQYINISKMITNN